MVSVGEEARTADSTYLLAVVKIW